MRFWLKQNERRPSAAPVQTDDRVPFLVGIALWVLALVASVLFLTPLDAAGNGWWLWISVGGVALGVTGLVYTHIRGRRQA